MARQLPPLPALRAFESAARLGSFVRAGEELCVSPGAVGHQLRQLEEWLGSSLFARGARSVELTEIGRRYFLEVKPLLEELERASVAVRDANAGDEVTVSAMPSFVTRWLMPRLGAFREHHADIEVRLLASVPPVDFARDRVDVAIRLGAGPYPGLAAEVLMEETFRTVAQPALCKRLTSAKDVLLQTLLHDEYEPRIPEQLDWPRWCSTQGLKVAPTRLRQGLRFSHTYLALDAAAAGQGVALASNVLAGDAVANGLLCIAPGKPVTGPYRYHLLSPAPATLRPQVRALCAWLRQEALLTSERGWGRSA